MVIKFYCTNCGQKLSAEDDQKGTKILCPQCSAEIVVPVRTASCESKDVQNQSTWWYYTLNNQQQGPVDEQVAITLIKSGVLTKETQVWTDGMTEWQQVGYTKLQRYFFNRPIVNKSHPPYSNSFDQRLIRILHKFYRLCGDAITEWGKTASSKLHLNYTNKISRKITIVLFVILALFFIFLSSGGDRSNSKGPNYYVIGISRQLRDFQASANPNDPEFGLKLILFEKEIRRSSDFSHCPKDYKEKFNACLDTYESAGAKLYSGQNSQSDIAEYAQRLQALGIDLHQCAIKYGAE